MICKLFKTSSAKNKTLSKACKGICVLLALLLSFKYTVQLVVNCQKIWCMEVFNVSQLNTKEYPLFVLARTWAEFWLSWFSTDDLEALF